MQHAVDRDPAHGHIVDSVTCRGYTEEQVRLPNQRVLSVAVNHRLQCHRDDLPVRTHHYGGACEIGIINGNGPAWKDDLVRDVTRGGQATYSSRVCGLGPHMLPSKTQSALVDQ